MKNKKVFVDFFKNPNYRNKHLFIEESKQIIFNSQIKEYCNDINDNKDISTLSQIFKKIKKDFKNGKAPKFERTSEEIFKSKILSGCSDYGIIFATVLRIKQIPTIYVQSAHIDWIEDLFFDREEKDSVKGHIFLEVFIKNKWYLLDSTAGTLYLNYKKRNFSLPKGYYVFSKSLDGWEVRCNSLINNNEIMKNIFKDFNLKKYKAPNYKKINIYNITNKK